MLYLSIDLEATGLEENAYIIEFAAVPLDADKKIVFKDQAFHSYIKCPKFEALKPNLSDWVISHNELLINKANEHGLSLDSFKHNFEEYLNSESLKKFKDKKFQNFTILGKSLNSIDIPFLNRDLGWSFIKNYFHHQVLDVSSIARYLIELGVLPIDCISGSKLSAHLQQGDVDHTALEDAIQTAETYFKLLEKAEILIKN